MVAHSHLCLLPSQLGINRQILNSCNAKKKARRKKRKKKEKRNKHATQNSEFLSCFTTKKVLV